MSTYVHSLSDKAAVYQNTMRSILSKAETEGRALTEAEQRDFDGLESKTRAALESVERAKRAQSLTVPAGTSIGNPRETILDSSFRSFGEFLRSVAIAGTPGGTVDPRLLETRAASGLGEGIGVDGGFLIEKTFVNSIFRRAYDLSELARRCRKIPVGENSDGVKIPYIDETSRATGSRLGGVRVYRAAEGDTVAASKPKFGRHEIDLIKLMGLAYATDELLRDSTLLGNVIMEGFSEEMAFTLDDEIFRGSGAGQCLGVLNSSALVTVSKESGPQTADTVNYENVKKMWARMWARSRKTAAWFINQEVEPQLYSMSQTVGASGYPVFMPSGGASDAPYATLFGRPIVPIEQASALGDLGDITLLDLSQYALIDRELQMAQSMHVRFAYDEMAFRTVYRVNGAPLWKSALTPYKGASTLSAFVALEAR